MHFLDKTIAICVDVHFLLWLVLTLWYPTIFPTQACYSSWSSHYCLVFYSVKVIWRYYFIKYISSSIFHIHVERKYLLIQSIRFASCWWNYFLLFSFRISVSTSPLVFWEGWYKSLNLNIWWWLCHRKKQ